MLSKLKFKVGASDINESQLDGFFVGWPNPPNNTVFLKLLNQSYKVILALDDNKVVGFVTAISDGVLSAYIPLLEVLPNYQSLGLGSELIKKLKNELNHLYMVDVICDENLVPYYEKQGLIKAHGAILRNYDNQNGNS